MGVFIKLSWLSLFYLSSLMTCYSALVIKLEQDTIELGKQLNISCEAINSIISGNRKWVKGTTSELLCYNGVPINQEKYHEERLLSEKYQLTINSVKEDDINCPYACRIGFQSAEIYVNANAQNFQIIPQIEDVVGDVAYKVGDEGHRITVDLPTPDMVHTGYVKKENKYSITVTFHRVYPVPSCTVRLKSQSKQLTVIKTQQNGLLYDVHLTDMSKEPYNLCGSPVKVVCLFGKTTYPMEIKHGFICIGHNESNILLPVVLSLSALTVITGIIVLTVLLHRRRKTRYPKQTEDFSNKTLPLLKQYEIKKGNVPKLGSSFKEELGQVEKCAASNKDLLQYLESNQC